MVNKNYFKKTYYFCYDLDSILAGSSPIGPTRQTHASHGVKVQG